MQVRDPSSPDTVWTVAGQTSGGHVILRAVIRRRNRKGTGFRNVECEQVVLRADLLNFDIVADVEI